MRFVQITFVFALFLLNTQAFARHRGGEMNPVCGPYLQACDSDDSVKAATEMPAKWKAKWACAKVKAKADSTSEDTTKKTAGTACLKQIQKHEQDQKNKENTPSTSSTPGTPSSGT